MAKSTLMTRAKSWGKKQGQNAFDGFTIIQESINQVIDGQNWDVLAHILGKDSSWSDKEKGIVKLILRECVQGLTMQRATNKNPHESGLRFEMDSPSWNDKGESFIQFIEGTGSDEKNQCRFTKSYVDQVIFENEIEEQETQEYTQEQAVKRAQALVKDLESKGFNPDAFLSILKQEIESNKVSLAA